MKGYIDKNGKIHVKSEIISYSSISKDIITKYNKLAYCIYDDIDQAEDFCKYFNNLNDGYNCKKCTGFSKSCIPTICHRLESVIDSLLEKL